MCSEACDVSIGVGSYGRLAGVAATIAVLAGCTLGPDFQVPPAPLEAGYGADAASTASVPVAAGAAQTFVTGKDIPGDWWALFRSRHLNGLIEQALKANPNLQAAQAALRQAKENVQAQ